MTHEGLGGMKHEAGVPSKTLTLTGLNGETKTLTAEDIRRYRTSPYRDGHSHKQETYSGVTVNELLEAVSGTSTAKPAEGAAKVPHA